MTDKTLRENEEKTAIQHIKMKKNNASKYFVDDWFRLDTVATVLQQ